MVRPRGIQIVEVSLVHWPAYERAGITSLSMLSAADQERHEESEKAILDTEMFSRELAVRRGRRRERSGRDLAERSRDGLSGRGYGIVP